MKIFRTIVLVLWLGAATARMTGAHIQQGSDAATHEPLAPDEVRVVGQIVDYGGYLRNGLESTTEVFLPRARESLAKGNPVGLLARDQTLYRLAPPPGQRLTRLVPINPGEPVVVIGRPRHAPAEEILEARKSFPAQPHSDHDADHGGVLGMSGDYHIELVKAHNGAFRVFVSDAFRRPISAGQVTGRLVAKLPSGREETHRLEPDSSGWYLFSRRVSPAPAEVTVRLARGTDDSLFMTFATDDAAGGLGPDAGELGSPKRPVVVPGFSSYDKIRRALARDSIGRVPEFAAALEAELRSYSGPGASAAAEAALATHQIAVAGTVADARGAFRSLTEPYIRFVRESDSWRNLVLFHCPMAEADWVQATRQTANPYYGSSMLRCGWVVPWREPRSEPN